MRTIREIKWQSAAGSEASSCSLFGLAPPLITVGNPLSKSNRAVWGDLNQLISSNIPYCILYGKDPAFQSAMLSLDHVVLTRYNESMLHD